MSAPEDALALLDAHEESHQSDGDYGELAWVECSCGADFEDPDGYGSGYRSHRAQVLAEWVAGEKARAWDEALRPLARVALRRYPNGLMSTATVIADIEESRRRNPYLTFGREDTP